MFTLKKKQRFVLCTGKLLLLVLVLTLFTGCSKKRIEEQTKLRDDGIAALAAGDYKHADDCFAEALRHAGVNVTEREINISYYRAAAQYLLQDHEAAIITYTNLIEYDEENAYAYFLRGSLHLDDGEAEKGIADYHRAAAVSKGDYDLHIEMYNNLSEMGFIGEASEFLNLALEIEGDKAENYLNRGRIYLILGQFEVAKTTLEKAIEKGSEEAKVYLAEVYEDQGNPSEAKKLIDEYMKNAEKDPGSLARVGKLLLEQGEYEQALETFQMGLESEELSHREDLLKGEVVALEFTGDFAQAKEKGNAFIAAYPSDGDMLREMIFLNTR